jgi:DNA primase
VASPFVELEVGERVVKLTNPDKVLFPARGETKRDLVDYSRAVGVGIGGALYERPTQLRRFPVGVEG